jgi:hypothetical protein
MGISNAKDLERGISNIPIWNDSFILVFNPDGDFSQLRIAIWFSHNIMAGLARCVDVDCRETWFWPRSSGVIILPVGSIIAAVNKYQ